MIGPVNAAARAACSRLDRRIARGSQANEIFFHLDVQTVYHDADAGLLYFIDEPHGTVRRTMQGALAGIRPDLSTQQMHLDPHRLFGGAHCARLSEEEARIVLVALRMAGVRAVSARA